MSNIIFDFDGTIADTLRVTIDTLHILLHRTDDPASPEEIEKIRGLTLFGAAKELHIPPWKVPYLATKGPRMAHRRMSTVPACEGMPEVLKALGKQGHEMYILSTNTDENIRLFLERHGMKNEFLKIYGHVSVIGKARRLRKILRENHLDKADSWYVGDEVRDLIAARRVGVRFIAVTWGYNNAKILTAHHPDYLVSTPEKLLAKLSEK